MSTPGPSEAGPSEQARSNRGRGRTPQAAPCKESISEPGLSEAGPSELPRSNRGRGRVPQAGPSSSTGLPPTPGFRPRPRSKNPVIGLPGSQESLRLAEIHSQTAPKPIRRSESLGRLNLPVSRNSLPVSRNSSPTPRRRFSEDLVVEMVFSNWPPNEPPATSLEIAMARLTLGNNVNDADVIQKMILDTRQKNKASETAPISAPKSFQPLYDKLAQAHMKDPPSNLPLDMPGNERLPTTTEVARAMETLGFKEENARKNPKAVVEEVVRTRNGEAKLIKKRMSRESTPEQANCLIGRQSEFVED